MAKQPKKAAVKPIDEKGTLTKAKESVVKAAGKVAKAVTSAAEAVNEHVVHPVAEAVGIVDKPKKPPARARAEKKAPTVAAKIATGTKKPTAKMMSKGITSPPKEAAKTGTKPKEKTKSGTKPKSTKK